VLGIALLLSGLSAAGSSLDAFRTGWLLMALGGAATVVCGAVAGAARSRSAPVPVPLEEIR
jgi:hypothetical protein